MTVVGYCRLSRDEDKENYASIEEQKRIIKDYAISRNWIIEDKDFYIDDNVSGYTFNRPEFSKMMKKVQGGEIDVVIAKDLSRIGRNNGKVLVLSDEFKNMQFRVSALPIVKIISSSFVHFFFILFIFLIVYRFQTLLIRAQPVF